MGEISLNDETCENDIYMLLKYDRPNLDRFWIFCFSSKNYVIEIYRHCKII